MTFKDRVDAGIQLAKKLKEYKGKKSAIVLGLPRGGVVVSKQVAKSLNLPMDILVTRKISSPGNEEFAIGAIDENGKGDFDQKTIMLYGVSDDYIRQEVEKQKAEAKRRLEKYREGKRELKLGNKTAIIVDDGIATGYTMKAAIKSARSKKARKIVIAVPVCPPDSIIEIKKLVDEVICLHEPDYFAAVGQFYDQFPQTEDAEVVSIMKKTAK